jgi:uncharacterized protein YihD (DUF1040 family)
MELIEGNNFYHLAVDDCQKNEAFTGFKREYRDFARE